MRDTTVHGWGTRPISAPILSFQHVYAAATKVTAPVTAHTPFRPELAHFTRVDARKHVNASVCAVARCIPLALLTLIPQQPPVTLQQPAPGVACRSANSRCVAALFFNR